MGKGLNLPGWGISSKSPSMVWSYCIAMHSLPQITTEQGILPASHKPQSICLVPCFGVSSAWLPQFCSPGPALQAERSWTGEEGHFPPPSSHLEGNGLPRVHTPGCKVMLYRLHWSPLLIHHTGDSGFIKYIAVISHLIY